MNERLKLISGQEPLMLDSTDGQETLAGGTDLFRYIDSNLRRWSCDVTQPPTKETPIRVYEVVRDSAFGEMFGGFGVSLDSLTLTQSQIKLFARRYPDWLKKGGNGTFFLFKVGNEFFVAAIFLFLDGCLGVRARRVSLERVFRAQKRHRAVLRSWGEL
jgi:hypothetical protein